MKTHLFFKGLSWLLILNIAIKPVWIFAIDRQVQNAVGTSTYGIYFSLLNLSLVFLFVADGGISNMLTQQIAANKQLNTSQLLKTKAVLLVLYALACCLFGYLWQITHWDILFYLIAVQALGSLFLFLRALLAANQLFKTDALFSVADKGLLILFCAPFIYGWWQPVTLKVFLQLQVFSVSIACVCILMMLLKKKLIFTFDKEHNLTLFKSALPFALIILLMGTHYRLDGFLVERLHTNGALEAGIYASSYRLLDAGNMPGYLAASFLVPFIARNRQDKTLIATTILPVQHFLLFTAIAASCLAWVFAPLIQQILYHSTYTYNTQVIQFCLAVLPAYYVTHIYGSVLTALSKFKHFISILTLSVLLNLCLNLILIPGYGALGCCIAALCSQYFCAACCYVSVSNQPGSLRTIKPWLVYCVTGILLMILLQLLKKAFAV